MEILAVLTLIGGVLLAIYAIWLVLFPIVICLKLDKIISLLNMEE